MTVLIKKLQSLGKKEENKENIYEIEKENECNKEIEQGGNVNEVECEKKILKEQKDWKN